MDASSRIPSGLLSGNVFDYGSFDQCLEIDENIGLIAMRGKMCTAAFVIPLDISGNSMKIDPIQQVCEVNQKFKDKIMAYLDFCSLIIE